MSNTIHQYLFVGVVVDLDLVTGQLYGVEKYDEWSCKHIDESYHHKYCHTCGRLAEHTTGERRVVNKAFEQDQYNQERFHYGKFCQIRLTQTAAAIFCGSYYHDCYGDGCPEKFMEPILLPTEAHLKELAELLQLFNLSEPVRIHYLVD